MMSAYTIKKVLPRLIAATIFIQFSFFIVSFLVDVFNVLGKGIGDLITQPINGGSIRIDFTGNEEGSHLLALGAIVGGVLLLKSVITGAILLVLVPLLLTFLAILFTLVFRQVLIVILVIMAPIAFVSWVLPNTERVFKIWWDFLLKALMMYPLIVILLASGGIVATIASGLGEGGLADGTSAGATAGLGDFFAIIAIIVPLALIPATFKFAGSAIAGVLGAFKAFGDKRMGDEKNPFSWRARTKMGVENRKKDLDLGYGAGYGDDGTTRIGSGLSGQILAHPIKGLTKKGRDRMSTRALGVRVEDAQKQLQGSYLDSLGAAQLVYGGQQRYQQMRAGMAGNPQGQANLDTLWNSVSELSKSNPHRLAAKKMIQESEGAGLSIDQWHDTQRRFSDNPALAERAWNDLKYSGLSTVPHYTKVSGETGQISRGGAAMAVAGRSLPDVQKYKPETMAHALRDAYAIDDGGSHWWHTDEVNKLRDDPRTSDVIKDMITKVQGAHAAGGAGAADVVLNDTTNQEYWGIDPRNGLIAYDATAVEAWNPTPRPPAVPSDIRLKIVLERIGQFARGVYIYRFSYKNDPGKEYVGLMAQELLAKHKYRKFVTKTADGYYAIYYDRLGFEFKSVS